MSSRRSFLLFLLVLSCLAIIPQARGIIRQEDDTGDTQQDSEESASGAESPKPDASLGSGPHLDDGASDVPAGSESDSATNKTSPDTSLENSSVLSSLYINTVKPGLGSPVTERVFKDGALHGLFNSCRTVAVDSSAPDAECFLDDQYNDRLTFEITYGVPGSDIESAFKANPPSLELLGDSSDSSSASISEYHVRAPTSNADVTVKYYCKRDADSVIDLELKIQFGRDSDSIVTIIWKKNCSSGVNPQLEFGYTTDDHKTGEKLRHPFGSEADRYVVPPSDVSTEVYAKLQQAGAQQEFLAPFVVSKDPSIVGVVVRGNHPNGGILQGLEMTEFQISYECVRKGSSDISVSVGIPPFDNVTSIWEKDCGGRVATELSVGNTAGGSEIVDMGKPTPKYMVGIENIGMEHSEEHLHLPGNQSEWTIYLTYGASDADVGTSKDVALHIGRIGVTVEHPEVIFGASPRLSTRRTLGWRDVANAENSLNTGDTVRISFHFVCRRIGESRLLITVPILDYDTLEFGIAKECDHFGSSHKARQFVFTVGNVFWSVLVIVVLAVGYYIRRRRKNAGFQPVANTEK